MAQAMEHNQVGKREALADLIANVEADATPVTSTIAKRKKPGNVDVDWQVKNYRKMGHRGVRDGEDAKNFNYNGRDKLRSVAQKTWDPRGVSDFAEESDVAGVKSEIADQTADALVTVKQTIERRILSNEDCRRQSDDDKDGANETRGLFSWLDTAAQKLNPVPEKYRPKADQLYTGTLAGWNDDQLKKLARAAWKRRMGNAVKMVGIAGIDHKARVSDFTKYDDEVNGHIPVRTFNQDAESKAMINVVDRIVLDTGVIDLMASAHIMTDPDTGEDTDFTHMSAAYVDMDKLGLAWTRMPRAVKLPYGGGGFKVIVDGIFCLMVDNPAGCFSARINKAN